MHRHVIVAVLTGLLLGLAPAQAGPEIITQKLDNLEVRGHYFTTAISGSGRLIYTKDPKAGRYMVMVLSADLPNTSGKVYTTDFLLCYTHNDGKEDRSRCKALAPCESTDSDELFDLGSFAVSDYGAVRLKSGTNHFAIAFYMEPDVTDIAMYRVGVANPTTYHFDSDRKFSVYISTNGGDELVTKTRQAIESGGYRIVYVSRELKDSAAGITIHYRDQAETQAREISQRLMTATGKVPTVKKMELTTEYDIVVWLGK